MSDTFEILQEKLIRMSQYIAELKQFSAYTYEEYTGDIKIKYSVERLLQLIVDLALDINNIILSYLKKPPASDYFNSFIELAEADVLPSEFAAKIAPATGLRNRLVHQYEKINDKIVYDCIGTTIIDFTRYMAIINGFIGFQ